MKVKMSLGYDENYNWWIVDQQRPWKTLRHGPFACVRDASITVCQMVADRSFEKYGHKVYFLEANAKVTRSK